MQTITAEAVAALYRKYNMIYGEKGLLQIDTQVALRKVNGIVEEAHLCNFNCDEAGGYACPARILSPLNKGVKKSTLPPMSALIPAIDIFATGIDQAAESFLNNGYFNSYCEVAEIPVFARAAIRDLVKAKARIKVNMFGGNSEVHPEMIALIKALKAKGYSVDFTTVGAAWMDAGYVEQVEDANPDVIALSIDDAADWEDLIRMFEMTLPELHTRFKETDFEDGQARKVPAAIYAAKLSQQKHLSSKLLFNTVVKPQNIRWIRGLVELVDAYLPGSLVNFYATQNSIWNKPGEFSPEEVDLFEELIDWMIEQNVSGNTTTTTRLHFWLILKSIYDVWRGSYQQISNALAGWGVWTCYRWPSFCGQLGGAFLPLDQNQLPLHPSMCGNCFWHPATVNSEKPFGTAEEAAYYLLEGRKERASKVLNPCPGCGFPRLLDDEMCAVPPLDPPELREAYIARRNKLIFGI